MLWPAPGLHGGFERGIAAEQLGYDDLWLPDAEGLQDPIALAAALGVATNRVRIGSAVVPVFNRAPAVLATGVVAAEQRAPGRFVLGLGASTSNMIERWYGLGYDKPLTRVRETLTLLRQIFNGEKPTFAGETIRSRGFSLKEQPTASIPIYLGAMGPRMLQLAGELADGVILNDFTPRDRIDWAMQQIDIGAKRRGRRVNDLEIIKRRAVLVCDDMGDGINYFRNYLGFYASAPAYQGVLERLGYAAEVTAIKQAYTARNRAAVADAISDAMVLRFFACGDSSSLQQLIRSEYAAGIDSSIISPVDIDAAAFARGVDTFAAATFKPAG